MGKIKIGLEVHMHLKTKQKLFCNCTIPKKHDAINSSICPICTGQPGSKPMRTNKKAFEDVIKLGLVFGSKIGKKTNFQRKHYTWPDMPTGYQRTVSGGNMVGNCVGGEFEGIAMEEVHLEEDPASWDPKTGEINYNRCGFALAEIVTKPDFSSTKQLKSWLQELVLVGKYLDALNEEYGIKSDVNVSVEESGFTRVEIKNVSSISGIVKAAEVEIIRQKEVLKQGGKILQETRRFDEELEETQFMRSKENAQDYMFTPEPDLPNLIIDDKFIQRVKESLPKLPKERRENYAKFGFDNETVKVLVSHKYLAEIFEHAIDRKLNPKEVGKFLKREILRVLNYQKASFTDLEEKNIKNEIIVLIELLGSERISYTTAQKILENLYENKFNVKMYVKANNLIQVEDLSLIEKLLREALKDSPKTIEDFKSGNTKCLNFIVGIVMRKTNGTAKPQVVNQILNKVVNEF